MVRKVSDYSLDEKDAVMQHIFGMDYEVARGMFALDDHDVMRAMQTMAGVSIVFRLRFKKMIEIALEPIRARFGK